VFFVALGGIIWLWQRAAAEKADIVSQLEDQQAQLNSLVATKPAPSPENIEALKREREQVSQLFSKLQEGTLRPQIAVTNLTRDIQFTQLLGETVPPDIWPSESGEDARRFRLDLRYEAGAQQGDARRLQKTLGLRQRLLTSRS
jgi:hypothetical protein